MNKRKFLSMCTACAVVTMIPRPRGESLRWRPEGPVASPDDDRPWKWSKEAEFYTRTAAGVRCAKCPHGCSLGEGDSGRCRSRVVSGGRLWSIAYGNPCAVHIDPIEKKPFYHVLPDTRAFSIAAAGCNLRCLNCQNWQISQFSPKETRNQELMPPDVVQRCVEEDCRSLAYTYSEPTTFYEYVYDTARIARAKGRKNLLKSNGYINPEPLKKLCTVLDAANIDLKVFDDAMYGKLSSARLNPVLETLKMLTGEGVWLEITNLVIPEWSDDPDRIKRMCEWLVKNSLQRCPLHFTRFTPLYKLNRLPMTPVATLERAGEIARKAGMEYVYIGNVPGHSGQSTSCAHCGKPVIERRGFAVLRNDVVKGKCRHCGKDIPGRWA